MKKNIGTQDYCCKVTKFNKFDFDSGKTQKKFFVEKFSEIKSKVKSIIDSCENYNVCFYQYSYRTNIFIETSVSCINGAWELIKFDLPIIRLNESNNHEDIKTALKTNKADFGLLDSNNIIVTCHK